MSKQKGFTIIEVVLVLAIAGLIFIIVFLALPQLQQSRRDTQRRDDIGKVTGALETYASSHDANYPADQTEVDEFEQSFTDDIISPSGSNYTIVYKTTAPEDNEMSYQNNSQCGNSGALAPGGQLQYAVSVKLEGGGYYCQGN